MRIREKNYTINYIANNTVTFEKWQVLAENCFDTDYIDFINAVLSTNVIFYTKIEEMCYNKTILEIITHRSNIINKQINENNKKINKKIHKSA